jgi:signal transduction histidine kinase
LLSRWPIRNKLLVGLALLVVIVAIASGSGLYGLYAYKWMVKSLSSRANELPLTTALIRHMSDLRVVFANAHARRGDAYVPDDADPDDELLRRDVTRRLATIRGVLDRYGNQLDFNEFRVETMSAGRHERRTFDQMRRLFDTMSRLCGQSDWLARPADRARLYVLASQLEELACKLPAILHERMQELASDVRGQYRSLIYLSWITTIIGGLLLALLVKLFYDWIFRPLRVLIKGSRRVALGQFNYRIVLDSRDEMAELADALNDMTARFRSIRDDLDRQVQERTKEVVRSERLASVGFLAAGVAHEINNPLASIAMCAESLEGRLTDVLGEASGEGAVVRQYLSMIQTEAFRCKDITERLLDFSRMGDVQRQDTELRELVQGVIDMVGHLGKYHDKHIALAAGPPVHALASPQEMKQVVLNLLTNALDSIDTGQQVDVRLQAERDHVELIVADNGCGMPPDVLEHLFEPFFTRKRGGQGTGLGLSITYRIIADHGGRITAHSAGTGQGSQFRVTLPRAASQQESRHRYQAA